MLLSILTQRESLRINKSTLLGFFFLLAFLGLLDAVYMTYVHYAHIIPPCINSGCEIVLKSKYTDLLGIPNAFLGVMYYSLVMVFIGVYWSLNKQGVARDGERTEDSEGVRLLDKRGTLNSSAGSGDDRSEFWGWRATGPLVFVNQTLRSLLLLLTSLGLLAGIGLLYIQASLIHAFCQYCVTSEIIDFLLFDCAWWLWRRSEK